MISLRRLDGGKKGRSGQPGVTVWQKADVQDEEDIHLTHLLTLPLLLVYTHLYLTFHSDVKFYSLSIHQFPSYSTSDDNTVSHPSGGNIRALEKSVGVAAVAQ